MKKKEAEADKLEKEELVSDGTEAVEKEEKLSAEAEEKESECCCKNDVESKIKDLEAENAELKDKFLRKNADFENFRKRMFKEKEDSIKFANTSLLGDLIPIIDDFERAINSADQSKDFDTFLKGVEMIEKQFASMLEKKWGLKRFDASGQNFDPEKHEAFMVEESPETKEPQVIEVFQKGYQLNDRVIRHAKVKVAMPAKAPDVDEKKEIKPEVQE